MQNEELKKVCKCNKAANENIKNNLKITKKYNLKLFCTDWILKVALYFLIQQ